MTVKINIFGVKSTAAFLILRKKLVEKATTKGLKKAALFVRGEVSTSIARGTNAPVAFDTGEFSRTVDFSVGKKDAIVFSPKSYGGFVEFGTSRMGARPHFRNTKSKNKQKIKEILKKEII